MEFAGTDQVPTFILPPKRIRRWVARHKASILVAVAEGLLSRPEACARYNISDEEFSAWTRAYARFGLSGLKAKTLARGGLRRDSRRGEEHHHTGLD